MVGNAGGKRGLKRWVFKLLSNGEWELFLLKLDRVAEDEDQTERKIGKSIST